MDRSIQDFEKSCVRRATVSPQWLSGSNSVFWYQREIGVEEFQFILVDCENGLLSMAFDHTELASKLSKQTLEHISPHSLPFWWINVAADAAWVRFQFHGQTWQYTRDGRLEDWQGDFDTGNFDHGCEEISSPFTRQSSTITFTNHTANAITYSWISNSGDPQYYGSLQPGQSKTVASYVGHIWRLAVEDSGKRIACAVKNQSSTAIIREYPIGLAISWETLLPSQNLSSAVDENTWRTCPKPFVRDFNIWVRNLDGSEKQISYRGVADNEFKNIFASPNRRHIIAWQCKPSSKSLLHLIESSPQNQLRPKLTSENYLRPGDNVELQRPWLFDLVAGSEIFVDNALFHNPYALTNIGWSENGQKYRFLFNKRGHQYLRLLEIGISGTITILAEEISKTFVDYANKLYYKLLPLTNELLWASERDGWNHLYLFNLHDGSFKNQVTKGTWIMRSVEFVDEDKRQIWFRGLGMVPAQDPYYAHLACVAFDGSGFRLITHGDGTHDWKWGPEKRFLIDSWSRVDDLPQAVIRVSETGKEVLFLQKEQLDPSLEGQWISPERFVAFGRDGRTNIYGIIIRPNDFDETKKYPVLEYIYAGPQSFYTPKRFQDFTKLRRVASQGYILVCVDGMGTNWRSKTFHDTCYKNLKDAGFADRIAWMSAAAKSRPWMDLSRVGCYGGSAGGQNAAAAVIHHSSFYKAASATAGCHDNRMDKLWWNELWMGYPVDASYENSSNITHAHKLGGALMLAVGELDTNVDPSSTLRLAQALIKAEKDFDLVFVPGGTHYINNMPFVMKKQDAFFRKHLQGY